ncbi:N-acylglucosamine 2-epimerase-like [Asterias amurensis]|uniref:N-acylglucosamine 2-epimerase-like n=1 Tax=Asterias amurensis TaxID=7602 RepID=UPI003AB6B74F
MGDKTPAALARAEVLSINPPRMPLGYIVETYPAAAIPGGYPAVQPGNPVLENNSFIPGESLRSGIAVGRSTGQSPMDLTTGSASQSRSSYEEGSHYYTSSGTPESRLQGNVEMHCEDIRDEEGSDRENSTYDECVTVLSSGASSFISETDEASAADNQQAREDGNYVSQDETLLPYSEVLTQRSVAYVINGYAYLRNRQQFGKIYLRCRERDCAARAMITNNVQGATVFNNTHTHPRPDLSKKAVKRKAYLVSPATRGSDEEEEKYSVESLRPTRRASPSPKRRERDAWHSTPLHGKSYPNGEVQHPPSIGIKTEDGGGVPRIVYVHSLCSSEMVSTAKSRLPEFLEKMELELDSVMDYWLKYSNDNVNGGFFTCLGRDGKRYDDLKYCWLQGSQVWTYCKLYNTIPKYHTPEVLQAAKKGGAFLQNYVKNPATGKCYFIITKSGKAVKTKSNIFSECFYILAMSELARATLDQKYKLEAVKMLDQLQHWVCVDDTGLGCPQLMGAPRVNSLSVAMVFLNLLDEVTVNDVSLQEKYAQLEKWSIEQCLQHMQRDGNVILETVSTDGKELPGADGRLMNPGHAIETGWFLLQCAVKHNLPDLKKLAVDNFITKPFQSGWDLDNGGLFSFLDVDGLSPTQLEWNMKLWWPHCEALIAFIMAYRETKEDRFLDMFEKVFDYTISRFIDPDHGEWFGYLSQEGKVTHDFKGGPNKGCFHIPRCLLLCTQILRKILKGE